MKKILIVGSPELPVMPEMPTKKKEIPTWEDIMRAAKDKEDARKAMLRKKGRAEFKKSKRRI